MRKLLLSLFVFAFSFGAVAQTFEWAKSMGGTNEDIALSVTVDNSGNVYTTGLFKGTCDFDPGTGTTNLTSVGGYDVYLSKFDAAGNFLWARRGGDIQNDRGNSVKVDATGNIYMTGFYQSTGGSAVLFVSKIDSFGNLIWQKDVGGGGNVIGQSIAIDAAGNVYTTGNFSGTRDFDPSSSSVVNLVSVGSRDVFILKLNNNGDFLWAKNMGGSRDFVYGNSIVVDASGDVYLTGNFQGAVDFDPSASSANLTSSGDRDCFILKFSANGSFVWANQLGGPTFDGGNSLVTDTSGNVFTTGKFSGTITYNTSSGSNTLTSAGSSDIFISKIDTAGNFAWVKGIGGPNTDASNSIAIDSTGYLYTVGSFDGTVDFDPSSSATSNLTSVGLSDVFISKYDSIGNFVSAINMGGTNSESGSSIALDQSGNIYTVGSFNGTADFDPTSGTSNLISAGLRDVFVSKLSQTTPCIVNIPDVNFKTYLVGNTLINKNGNSEIECSEASSFTGTMFCTGLSINDLTGIEAFTSLNQLRCNGNSLSSLNIVANTMLTFLDCRANSLTSLDVSSQAGLLKLYCSINPIVSLDVSANTNLTRLEFENTRISSMDLSANSSLIRLQVSDTPLLTSLNVANGNNTNVLMFHATNTPNLSCIEVDDVAYSTTNWTGSLFSFDATSSFSTDCGTVGIIEKTLDLTVVVYPNPAKSFIQIANDELVITKISIIDLRGKTVSSFIPTSKTIDVSSLLSGIYFLQIHTNETVINSRFIKE